MTRQRESAADLIRRIADPGTFVAWNEGGGCPTGDPGYDRELDHARRRTGTEESVITGRCQIGGQPVVLIVSEFGFLGGSLGIRSARRLTAATERATTLSLPVLAFPASGGTRMQEGTPAFVEMATIARVVTEHKRAALPFVVYLRHPTTGGAFASWGSLGHVTFAEPRALTGFLGPRVYAALHGSPFPAGVQQAENLVAHGIVDAVVPPDDLAVTLHRTLCLLTSTPEASPGNREAPQEQATTLTSPAAWDGIERTRNANRPGIRDLLAAAGDVVELSGSGHGERGDGIALALASISGRSCVVVGHDRHALNGGAVGPDALRVVQRGFALAKELRLPLLTVIDTPGAELSARAEQGALAREIADCLSMLTTHEGPSVSVLLGQGCGGAALALLPARQVIAAGSAWLSPLPLEGASVIRYGDVTHAAEMAQTQRVTASALYAAGIVDRIVAEPMVETGDWSGFCREILTVAMDALTAQTVLVPVGSHA